jgi:CHAD domain-containing protein
LFTPASGSSLDATETALAGTPGWARESTVSARRCVLDTFDWRAHRRGVLVEHETSDRGSSLLWRRREDGIVESRQPVDRCPRFYWELAAGRVRDLLEDAIGVRALLPLADVHVRRQTFWCVDDEGKTVVRVAFERLSPVGANVRDADSCSVRIEPLRGYGRAADDAAQLLVDIGLERTSTDPTSRLLEALGHRPGGYSSKLHLDIRPDLPAADAYREVLGALLTTAETNRPGTIEDLDSEFLHDFRVAVRRSRSILKSASGVLPDDETDLLAGELKWLGQSTGPPRDFDVWLLGWDELVADLEPAERTMLEPMREHVESERRAAHDRLRAALSSDRYRTLVATWHRVVDGEPPDPPPEAALPIRDVAAARVDRALRKVRKRGCRIDDTSPGQELHTLRKRAKKLRYLLECFRSTLREEPVEALVDDLKRLQDVLGEFQDAEVQIQTLRSMAVTMQEHEGASADTLLATGVLVSHLRDRQQKFRAKYSRRFDAFDETAEKHSSEIA